MAQMNTQPYRGMLEAELWELVSRAKKTGVIHARDLKALLWDLSLGEVRRRELAQKLESMGISILPEGEAGSCFYPRMEEMEKWYADKALVGLYLAELKKNGIVRCLPREEEDALACRCSEDEAAAGELTDANLLRVVSMVRQYAGQGADALDLLEAGNRGLMHSVQSYSTENGVPFLLWAVSEIRREIQEELKHYIREFRIPEEIIQEVLKQKRERQSVPEPAADRLLPEDMKEILDRLTPREAEVIRMRLGLMDGQIHTQAETAQQFGITPERVRQIERKALRRIHIRRRNYRDFFGPEESQNFPQETADESAASGETDSIGEIIL